MLNRRQTHEWVCCVAIITIWSNTASSACSYSLQGNSWLFTTNIKMTRARTHKHSKHQWCCCVCFFSLLKLQSILFVFVLCMLSWLTVSWVSSALALLAIFASHSRRAQRTLYYYYTANGIGPKIFRARSVGHGERELYCILYCLRRSCEEIVCSHTRALEMQTKVILLCAIESPTESDKPYTTQFRRNIYITHWGS